MDEVDLLGGREIVGENSFSSEGLLLLSLTHNLADSIFTKWICKYDSL
jgi:hypothetical protein